MIVWPVSSSVRTEKVGSSSESDAERLAQLVLVGLGLGLDRDVDDRLGELHALEHDRVRRVAERLTGRGVLEADRGDDVAGEDRVHVLPVVRVHLEDAADALLAVLRRVEDRGAGGERAGVDPEVGELADVRVAHDLERERGERLGVVRVADQLLLALDVGAVDRRDVERARHVVDDRVEQRLDALVLERGAAEDRDGAGLDGGVAEALAQVLGRDLLVADVLLEHVLVVLGDDVDELVAPLLGVLEQVSGDVDGLELLAHAVVPDQRLHLEQVDDAAEAALGADRQLDRARPRRRGGP